jgi:mono/diheme cytochrome c family protein
LTASLAGLLFIIGCQQDMARQPKYKPLQDSAFFSDGRASRPLEPGTVARGYLREDRLLYGAEAADAASPAWAAALVGAGSPLTAAVLAGSAGDGEADVFPFPVTEEVLHQGRESFNVYCSMCHSRLGDGNGKIVQRGYVKPPSYHIERLRNAPVGHFFNVVSHGWGAMPEYGTMIVPQDRWRIVAYVRALQLSQNMKLEDVPAEARAELEKGAQP